MYRIIGADGREYGPVNAEQIRLWISEGRANAQTRTVREGAAEGSPLASLPEFSPLFGARAVPQGYQPVPTPRPTNPLALAGLILAIASLTVGMCCCYGIPLNVLGLIFSLVGLSQIRHAPELYNGQGIAIAGVVLSIASLLFGILAMGIFGLISIAEQWPRLHRL